MFAFKVNSVITMPAYLKITYNEGKRVAVNIQC